MAAGSVRFDPADLEHRTFIGQHNPAYDYFTLLIPPAEADASLAADAVTRPVTLRHVLVHDDGELQWCMRRLSAPAPREECAGSHHDEAARRLVLRLHRLSGGPPPDWDCDASGLDRVTLRHLVDHIDAHLRCPPSLADMALRAALSPSHFARKFRRATGFSLQRFVNRRRIQASLGLLRDQAVPLAHVAYEVGLSSQSHFTRLFSGLTGMTPARYRKQFRRTLVGWRATAAARSSQMGGGG